MIEKVVALRPFDIQQAHPSAVLHLWPPHRVCSSWHCCGVLVDDRWYTLLQMRKQRELK